MNKFVCFLVAMVFSFPVLAKEELWLVTSGFSHHFGGNKKHNEKNWGLGIEYNESETWKIVAGQYRNSVGRNSWYFGKVWVPEQVGELKGGITLAALSGYTKNGRLVPLIAPTIMWEKQNFGANMLIVPPYEKGSNTIIGFQLKWKLN